MAKLLYNLIAFEGSAAELASDKTVFAENALIFSDDGVLKRGNGKDVYADLPSVLDPADPDTDPDPEGD